MLCSAGSPDLVEQTATGGGPTATLSSGRQGHLVACSLENRHRRTPDRRLVVPHPGVIPQDHPTTAAGAARGPPAEPGVETTPSKGGQRRGGVETKEFFQQPTDRAVPQQPVGNSRHEGPQATQEIRRRDHPVRQSNAVPTVAGVPELGLEPRHIDV